jgi:hypothetical protein
MANLIKSLGKITVLIIVLATALNACPDEPRVIMAPGYGPTATDIPQVIMESSTPVATAITPTPTIPYLSPDNDLYALLSQALAFYPPLGLLLQIENPAYVKFTSRDSTV